MMQIKPALTPTEALLQAVKFSGESKYMPHIGERQKRRALRQIRTGTVKGAFITDEARRTAHGE